MKLHRVLLLIVFGLSACEQDVGNFEEASIAALHDQMQRGELTSEQLVHWYLDRIEALDRSGPELNSVIELNPDALMIARALDEEWAESGPRGPLHGIPWGAKDLLAVQGYRTTWGAEPYKSQTIDDTAAVVRKLEEAVLDAWRALESRQATFERVRKEGDDANR